MLKFKVVSDSMSPLIPVGTEVYIRKFEMNDVLKRFDILLFKQGDRLICHYFWHENKVFDKGLINTRCIRYGGQDNPFSRSQIIGVVTNFKIGCWLRMKILIRDFF